MGSGVTYTEAQAFCAKQYAAQGKTLIEEVKQHLDSLNDAEIDSVRVLRRLNELSIELSTFNLEWDEFSLAVFETIVFPHSQTWTARYLRLAFNRTIKRLEKIV